MIIIPIGVPGAGKGTQSKALSARLGIPHISTGEIFRNIQGKLKKIDSLISKGNFVPDKLTFEVLKPRLEMKDCKQGFILDGYPRNLKQAKLLYDLYSIDYLFEIYVGDELATKRLLGRRECKPCELDYNMNVSYLSPIKDELCDICENQLSRRKDDSLEYIERRLKIYHNETEKIVSRYPSIRIIGNNNVRGVNNDILRVINSVKKDSEEIEYLKD